MARSSSQRKTVADAIVSAVDSATPAQIGPPAVTVEERLLLASLRELPRERIKELREIVETMLDEEEDKRDMRARRRLLHRASKTQNGDL
jgi:hypothetical protein